EVLVERGPVELDLRVAELALHDLRDGVETEQRRVHLDDDVDAELPEAALADLLDLARGAAVERRQRDPRRDVRVVVHARQPRVRAARAPLAEALDRGGRVAHPPDEARDLA